MSKDSSLLRKALNNLLEEIEFECLGDRLRVNDARAALSAYDNTPEEEDSNSQTISVNPADNKWKASFNDPTPDHISGEEAMEDVARKHLGTKVI